jgi:hypothetical protein
VALNGASVRHADSNASGARAWWPEVVLGQAGEAAEAAAGQAALPLAAEGVLRYVWHSRYGDMLIEVIDGQVFVNGSRVQPRVG